MARCPAHDDRNPSLHITFAEDGKILLKCQAGAGCPTEEIVRAAGLEMPDLFPPRETPPPRQCHGLGPPIAEYVYHDEAGVPVGCVRRYEGKRFAQFRFEDGRYVAGLNGVRLPLYRLPEVKQAISRGHPVLVLEGEKDADRAAALGFTATTSPAGGGKWKREHTEALAGADVLIIPDRDGPSTDPKKRGYQGQHHALAVARSLDGVAKRVRIALLAKPKDLSDFADRVGDEGAEVALTHLLGSAEEVEGIRIVGCDELAAMIAEPGKQNDPTEPAPLPLDQCEGLFVTTREIGQTAPEQIDFTAEPYFAIGAMTVVGAKTKVGKTSLICDYMERVVHGGTFLGLPVKPGAVVFLTEQTGETLRSYLHRFDLLDTDAVVVMHYHTMRQAGVRWSDAVALAVLKAKAMGAHTIVIDTLSRFAGMAGESENNAGDMQAAIDPLWLARADGFAVIVAHHFNRTHDGIDAFRGSTVLTAEADQLVMITRPTGHVADKAARVIKTEGRLGPESERTITLGEHGFEVVGEGQVGLAVLIHDAILDLLPTTSKTAMSVDAIRERLATKASSSTVRDVIKGMVGNGVVTMIGSGERGDPQRYFCAPGSPPRESPNPGPGLIQRNPKGVRVPLDQSTGNPEPPRAGHAEVPAMHPDDPRRGEQIDLPLTGEAGFDRWTEYGGEKRP